AETHPDVVLLVVGRALEKIHLDALLEVAEQLGVTGNIRFTGHVPRHVFDANLVASDVVLNLRVPSHVHMSATVMRGIAAGRPNVVSDLPFWRYLPGSFCWRVPCDETEEPVLAGYLGQLASDPELRAQMSAAARAYYLEEGTVDAMASRYLDLIERIREDAGRDLREAVGPGDERVALQQ